MSAEKPSFLSQPVVKNIFMFRNGDPYYEARRIVINEKRVCNFETLLREVTGGIQAPFGAVRNIYTPRGGHKVDCMESLQSGEQYVAAGKERFKRLDYQQIGTRKKRMMQSLPLQTRPLPQNRIAVSARFLKPIREPCPIFVVANGDVLNSAIRLLIHQRMMGEFDKILEMITEKMGLRVLGGVRSLFTSDGQQVTDGNKLENGQLYVAVGRERFKKLPYNELLFTKPRGTRRLRGMKTYSLPPIYRFSNAKHNGNSKSDTRCSNSGDSESKTSSLGQSNTSKEHLPSIVREISQTKLLSLRKRKSGQSFISCQSDNDYPDSKVNGENAESKTLQEEAANEKPDDDIIHQEKAIDKVGVGEETISVNSTRNQEPSRIENEEENLIDKENQEPEIHNDNSNTTPEDGNTKEKLDDDDTKASEERVLVNGGGIIEKLEDEGQSSVGEKKETDVRNDQNDERATAVTDEQVEEQKKAKVTEEKEGEMNSEEQRCRSANNDKIVADEKNGDHDASAAEREQEENTDEGKEEPDSCNSEDSRDDHANDVNMMNQKEKRDGNDQDSPSAEETNMGENNVKEISNDNQEEESKEPQEKRVSGEVMVNDDGDDSSSPCAVEQGSEKTPSSKEESVHTKEDNISEEKSAAEK